MGRKKTAPHRGSRRMGQPAHAGSGVVRIIGGEWRGRKLTFPDVPGLRPSTDRVRETLFNWLMYDVAGARCLDLFCGSGALGLEALSRGASFLLAMDQDRRVVQQMRQNLLVLECERAQVLQADAIEWLKNMPVEKPFDLVFLDPPFHKDMLDSALRLLVKQDILNPGAWVYVESEVELGEPDAPACFERIREKRAGQVQFRLYRKMEAS